MKTYLEEIQIKKSKIKRNMENLWQNVKSKDGKGKKRCLNISKNKENKYTKTFVQI